MNINKTSVIIAVVCLMTLHQIGCAAHVPPYNTVIRNIGTIKFSDSEIVMGGRILSAGWVTPGNYKINGYPSAKLTDQVIVKWQRIDGKQYEQIITLKGQLPRLSSNESYYLIFDINDDNRVVFKAVVCGDKESCIDKW